MELTISVRDLRTLVNPVIPCASTDAGLPMLTAVRIESRGKYLTAVATDRFRMAMQRVVHPDGETWPEWSANVPVSALKSIFATFKPSFRDANPVLTLITDGEQMRVAAEGALLDLFAEAHVTYRLQEGNFPKVRKLIRDAIAAESTTSHVGLNPALVAGVLPKGSRGTAAVKITDSRAPILITDGEDFISILMPRRIYSGNDEATHFPRLEDWAEVLADEPEKKARKRPARKAS